MRMAALGQRVCRRVVGNIPGRRLARRAGRTHVGGRLRGSRTCAGGGGLVDRRDSTDVMASSGTSAPVRNPQRASPGFTVEEQASHGRHPLAVSKAFRALPPTRNRLRALRATVKLTSGFQWQELIESFQGMSWRPLGANWEPRSGVASAACG